MDRRVLGICAALTVIATVSLAQDSMTIGGEVNGIEIETSSEAKQPAPAKGNNCMAQCSSAETRCGSEVRRARQQCSREAAMEGREAFPNGFNQDYGYFCSYFRRARACGPGCELRSIRRHDMCLDALNNTASMRHDCFLQERQAVKFCREELRDCKSACK